MNKKNLISFTSNDESRSEYEIFEQLYKIIESYEYNNKSHDTDSETEDPINEIKEEFEEICNQFIQVLEESGIKPMTQQGLNDVLNEHSKDKIIKLFENDNIDKDNFSDSDSKESEE